MTRHAKSESAAVKRAPRTLGHLARRALRRGMDRIQRSHMDADGRQCRPYGQAVKAILHAMDGLYALLHLSLVRRMERRGEGRALRRLRTSDWKHSDTVYILGSGSSINAITEEQWAAIAACDSIGLNFWPIHPFVPSILFLEISADAARNRAHAALMERRVAAYAATPVVVNIREAGGALDAYPRALRERWYLYPAFLGAKSRRLLRGTLRAYAFCARRGIDVRRILPNHSGSLSTAILFAILSGHKHIVLCGVDLDTEYFWEHREHPDPAIPTPPNTQVAAQHSSLDPRNPYALTIVEFLEILGTVRFPNADYTISALTDRLSGYPIIDN